MNPAQLTVKHVRARPVRLPLKRPIVSRVGLFRDWPLILIDLHTNEGVVGRSYLEPYLEAVGALHRAGDRRPGAGAPGQAARAVRRVSPSAIGSLHLVGREGLTLIAVVGPRHGGLGCAGQGRRPAAGRFLGGTLGPVPAYNSNGLWLTPLDTLAARSRRRWSREGGFTALKLRLGRERLADDLAAIAAVREAAGADVKLMCDFNQGLSLGDALLRCHALDDQGLYWFEEPIAYDNFAGYAQLARELKTPVQLGENFYGPRRCYPGARRPAPATT